MTHILIVDDHAVFAESLEHRLNNEEDFKVIATASDAAEAKGFLTDKAHSINIALLDIRIKNNETEGLELASYIRNSYRGIKVIMLSMHSEGSYGKKMLDAGIEGYVLKSSHIEEVIRYVNQGKRYYSKEIEDSIGLFEKKKEKIKESKIVLTKTEKRILNYLADGLSSREIAEEIGNKEATVEVHRRNIFAKFGVNKVALLIKKAIALGFIEVK
ncbi:MAG: response regulator transcription factor [Bacteroidia bacterium]|nr:response regulator transcription factor [Bacteroidia bacterium]